MKNAEDSLQPILSHAEPVLAVRDVEETIRYWHDILGFPGKWTWGEPPNHGGVSWNNVFVQFSLNPALASVSEGHSIWIRVRRLEALYALHQKKKAKIVAPLENKPWGMAEYTVQEINGYYLHFSAPSSGRTPVEGRPANINVITRKPSVSEYMHLMSSVGWAIENETMAELRLATVLSSVVAEESTSGEVIGCALLLGDNASFYYVKDVIVHPDWQGKRVGTAMMYELTRWLEKNAANNSLVSLISNETLEHFYQQFGFAQSFAMIRYIKRNEQ